MNPIDTLDLPDTSGTGSTQHRATPPTDAPGGAGRPWSTRRRVLVASAVVVVTGILGTAAVIAARDDDGSDGVEQLREQLDDALAARDAALGDVEVLDEQIALLDARLGAVEAERDRLADDLDRAAADDEQLVARIDELDAAIVGVRAELADAVSARDTAVADATRLEADLDAARAQAADAERLERELTAARAQRASAVAERDALARRFPVTVDPSFDVTDVVGTYRAMWQEQACSGLASCGTPPSAGTATLRATPEGYLRLELGTVVTTNLSRIPGGLHAVTGTASAVPACDGVGRTGTVTVTLLPDRTVVGADGSIEIRSWGGAVTISAPSTDTCPPVLASYGLAVTS